MAARRSTILMVALTGREQLSVQEEERAPPRWIH